MTSVCKKWREEAVWLRETSAVQGRRYGPGPAASLSFFVIFGVGSPVSFSCFGKFGVGSKLTKSPQSTTPLFFELTSSCFTPSRSVRLLHERHSLDKILAVKAEVFRNCPPKNTFVVVSSMCRLYSLATPTTPLSLNTGTGPYKDWHVTTSSACTTSTEPSPGLWTVEQLKIYLKEKELPVSGRKNELVKRFGDFQEAEALQAELGAVAFQNLSVPAALPFESLPNSGWSIGELPQVTEERDIAYLKRLGGFMKNYRTGVRLCQCGHIYDIEGAPSGSRMYVRAKCRPTMRKQPPFYKLFVTIARRWKDPNLRLKVLIAIVQQVKPRAVFM